MSRIPILRRKGLRFRITFTSILTSVTLAAVLSTATFIAVREFLEDQRIRFANRQTVLALLFGREFFLGDAEVDPEALVVSLQARPGFQALLTTPTDYYSTMLAIRPESVPDELQEMVREEQLAYQETMLDEERVLVYGAPLPPEGTDLYLFYSLESIDETLSVLLRVLIVASLTVVVIAIVSGRRTSTRILRPLLEVSTAARRVAEGLLETRVHTGSGDEVGMLAGSFNEMAAAFQEMIERERRFVANVSHELRTPLATLRTVSELLERHRDEFSPAAREAVDLLVEDVTNLRRLVEELMEVSDVDSGRARIRVEDVELRSLAEAIAARRHREIPVEGPVTVVTSDKSRLERIITNLIDNALDHGEGRDVRVEIASSGEVASVAVSDRGPGISPEDLPLLFDRFYKADTSRSREQGGVGLGLAIALENARLLGGTIDAESRPGEETRFILRLPARAREPEHA